MQSGAWLSLYFLGELLIPFMLVMVICCILSNRFQTGNYFSFGPLKWKPERLNPVSGMKSLMPNLQNMVKLGLTMAKVAVVGLFVYWTLIRDLDSFTQLPRLHLMGALAWIFKEVTLLALQIFAFFAVVAALDFIYKRYDYYENLKMTKQEVKDEHRNAEGDPMVKGRIRRKMMEMSFMRMITEIPKADVVVTNPTHVAVALRYTPGSYAPRVVAKGLRKRAERIKAIAREHAVPIVEAPPLARSLYRHTKVGGYIPEHLFRAVAAILARIHRQRRRNSAESLTQSMIQAQQT
ncbi:MAG: EscU/YscU/HrcU family type III secretion system export apparatus switch protein [Lentisphaerae bacterium]|nr:MAG: EscU/YscU/HrcU family type III secretion system export apparatus switch protein [Lentisphaerota bacterium]